LITTIRDAIAIFPLLIHFFLRDLTIGHNGRGDRMPIEQYEDFVITTGPVENLESGDLRFSVEGGQPSVGDFGPEWQTLPRHLDRDLRGLERRRMAIPEIIAMGESLADVIMPGDARNLVRTGLSKLKPGGGLRLRLRLAPELGSYPWEYLYVQRGDGEKDLTGFLALDPRVSITRHERIGVPGMTDETPRSRRLLVALANPEGTEFASLDLAQERENIEVALQDVPGIDPDFLEGATAQGLADLLQTGADIFHFAGHGVFRQTGLGAAFGTIEGKGAIVLESPEGEPEPMPADQLAVNLQGRGVQLVVLGACQTGRRDGQNVWSGVVAALMEAGVPAAVAMQFQIWDDSAIAFSRSFYRALAAGLPLDQAVSSGRLAVFNLCHPLLDDPERAPFWRDWGVPVLYQRGEGDFRLPAVADREERQAIEAQLPDVSGPPIRTSEVLQPRPPGRGRQAEPLPGSLETDAAEIRDLRRQLERGRLVLFVGADFPESLSGVPGLGSLADSLAEREGLEQGQRFARVAQQVMSHGNRWEFTDFLRRSLETTDRVPGPLYRTLAALVKAAEPELIITTAFHRMLEWALRDVGDLTFNSVARDDSLRFADPDRPTLIKLYGDIDQVDTLVATEQDQNALLRGRDKPEMVDEVRRAFRRNSVLFLGYDLSDPAVTALFDEVAGDRFQIKSYAVWSGLSTAEAESYRSNRGLTVIDADPVTVLRALMPGEGGEPG
jgi:hypothetical protein